MSKTIRPGSPRRAQCSRKLSRMVRSAGHDLSQTWTNWLRRNGAACIFFVGESRRRAVASELKSQRSCARFHSISTLHYYYYITQLSSIIQCADAPSPPPCLHRCRSALVPPSREQQKKITLYTGVGRTIQYFGEHFGYPWPPGGQVGPFWGPLFKNVGLGVSPGERGSPKRLQVRLHFVTFPDLL